jgi:transposase
MAQERLTMKDVKELLRLRFQLGLTQRQVARASGFPRATVQNYEERAKKAGLTDPQCFATLSAEGIYAKLGFKTRSGGGRPVDSDKPIPNCNYIHEELRRHKHTTLMLLWTEYRDIYPDGYQYTQFCEYYKRFAEKLSIVMRQEHKAGEKAFIDYAGDTIDVIDGDTGEVRHAVLFVGVLGASSYTFCEATWSQSMPDWLASNRRMLDFFRGVPEILVPDNLRAGVSKADRYEAKINPSYQEFAEHYGTCVIPARARKPKDKAKVEVGVLVAERWILAALRNRTFFSLAELNDAIRVLLDRINNKKMRHLGKSRQELFEQLDLPALKALNPTPYEYGEWQQAGVNIDYHIKFDVAYYSVHHSLIGAEVFVRATQRVVEIYHNFTRVALHERTYIKGKYQTDPSHRPIAHQEQAKWTPERITNWAQSKGGFVRDFIAELIKHRVHSEQAYRSALGIIRMADKYGDERLNQACQKALQLNSISYVTIKNMLQSGMDKIAIKKVSNQMELLHENVRGSEYYH